MRWLDGIIDSVDRVWIYSRSWWWTGWPGMLRFMESQNQTRLSDWTELNVSKNLMIFKECLIHITDKRQLPEFGRVGTERDSWTWKVTEVLLSYFFSCRILNNHSNRIYWYLGFQHKACSCRHCDSSINFFTGSLTTSLEDLPRLLRWGPIKPLQNMRLILEFGWCTGRLAIWQGLLISLADVH